MERYKDYRVPISSVKAGSLLKRLAKREQTTSDDILHSATKPDPQDPNVVGSVTSPEELLEALDRAIGPEDLEHHERESLLTLGDTGTDGDATVTTPTRRRRRSKWECQAAADGSATPERLRFVELTKLLPPMPKKGNFEVNAVKKSLYFFS